MTTSLVEIEGANGDRIHAYVAQPDGRGPLSGVVLIHHAPGFDELYLEFTRRFAQHGYNAICPDLYCRNGHGKPDDVTAKMRANGGVADKQVIEDAAAAMRWLKALPTSNGKVGIIGSCSGGRHAMVIVGSVKGFDAVVDLWGGRVVMPQSELSANQPTAPIDFTKDVSAAVLGIFGNDDKAPSPAEVHRHEEELKKHRKTYEFHRYDGAGHGFFYYDRPMYRAEQAADGWNQVFAFFARHLA